MAKTISESAISGLNQASGRFERSAAEVTRLSGAHSAAETAVTVKISPEARGPAKPQDNSSNARLEGAMVDMRISKYQFIANLRVLQTGEDVDKVVEKLGRK
jgi:hypothetical protein